MPLYQHQQTEVHRFQNPVRVKRLIAYFVTVLYTMYFEKVLELEKWFHKYSESSPFVADFTHPFYFRETERMVLLT